MRVGPPHDHVGTYHQAGFYESDEEFLNLLLPFVREGVAVGEPVITGYDERKTSLLREALGGDMAGVTAISDAALYASPARCITAYQKLFDHHVTQGAHQIRVGGDVPHPGNGGSFDGWDRYESAVNTVWGELPVWGFCLYDRRMSPAYVVDAVERTHPELVDPYAGAATNPRYDGPWAFRLNTLKPDPLEASEPQIVLVDPAPRDVRLAIADLGAPDGDDAFHGLMLGASEAVANALAYGRAPVTVRVWRARDRLLVTVHDTGDGPSDPLVGLKTRAPHAAGAGLGLWLTHQMCDDVTLHRDEAGFTVRLRTDR